VRPGRPYPRPTDGIVVETRGVTKEFAGFRAVNGVDLRLEAGRVHALVGPNGAGKTSLFNLLTGFLKPTSGEIHIFGRDATELRPDEIARLGVARSFQITSLFEQLSVLEHVLLALQSASGSGRSFWSSEQALRRFVPRGRELLAEVGLAGVAERPASSLPYGQKRALELALALALEPRLLLLDEPTSGMGLEDVGRTIALVRMVAAGRTVVLVEHNMGVVAELAERVIVMQQGRIIADGPYSTVRRDPAVIAAYLGLVDA
jgi:branched-chain amino acid transport system ATP-binding protein